MWYGEKETTGGGEGHKKNKTATLRTVVRKRKEQEQGDITHSEMAVMTEAKKEKLSGRISVIPLMRCCSVVLVFQPPRCGHLCHRRSLWTSSPKVCSNIHSVASAVMVWVQAWKLGIRSKGGPFAVTLETSSGLWSYFVLRCLPESSHYDRRGRGWGEGWED